MSGQVDADEAVERFAAGEFLVLVDSGERENEGDLIVAAAHLTTEKAAFLMREARGMFLLSTTRQLLERAGIGLIEPRGGDVQMTPRMGLPFDARAGVRTGISARDRAETVRAFLDPGACADDFLVPGHVQPLAEHEQGFRVRQGHTEGSVGLARLAGLTPAAIMSEILTPGGDMARGEELADFARHHGVAIARVDDVAARALR